MSICAFIPTYNIHTLGKKTTTKPAKKQKQQLWLTKLFSVCVYSCLHQKKLRSGGSSDSISGASLSINVSQEEAMQYYTYGILAFGYFVPPLVLNQLKLLFCVVHRRVDCQLYP